MRVRCPRRRRAQRWRLRWRRRPRAVPEVVVPEVCCALRMVGCGDSCGGQRGQVGMLSVAETWKVERGRTSRLGRCTHVMRWQVGCMRVYGCSGMQRSVWGMQGACYILPGGAEHCIKHRSRPCPPQASRRVGGTCRWC